MSLSNLARSGGGLASIAAGALLVAGHVFDLGGDPEYGTVVGKSLVLAAHVALVFGAAITCAGFAWLGLALMSGPGSGATTRQPAPVG